MHHDEFVELLVGRADNLLELYPTFNSSRGVPQYGIIGDRSRWFFDTRGWIGGMEFTLKRKQYVPSLQVMCSDLLPRGETVFSRDGSLVAGASALKSSGVNEEEEGDIYEMISKYIRSCNRTGMRYILDVLHNVRRSTRGTARIKKLYFSDDWSTLPATSSINKVVLLALGGARIIVQTVEKGKLSWSCAFGGPKSVTSKEDKREVERKRMEKHRLWHQFISYIAPVVTENEQYYLLATEMPDSTLLTLRIEGVERSSGSYEEEKFTASATVQVPATLNFFQLHRAVMQTMNCRPDTMRETHEWRVPNIGSHFERAVTDDHCSFVQLGENYFVEDGRREDYGGDESLFDRGAAIRQRISGAGAFFDRSMPLFSEKSFYGCIRNHSSIEKIVACVHSTCIDSVFFQPGTTALLQDGLCKYMAKFKITCMKRDEYDGPLPANPDLNVMQPKCLRGKPEEGDDDEYGWSVAKANKQLERDRGCLRRKDTCGLGSEIMTQMPWCKISARPQPRNNLWGCWDNEPDVPYPLAAQLTGLDHYPMFLYGEPPLPGSDEYEDYVSTLNGRIDPKFLPENVANFCGGFSVPFGGPAYSNYDSDDGSSDDGSDKCIGRVWTREVDEEMKRMSSLQPAKEKSKGSGKKRKAPANPPQQLVQSNPNPSLRPSTAQSNSSTTSAQAVPSSSATASISSVTEC